MSCPEHRERPSENPHSRTGPAPPRASVFGNGPVEEGRAEDIRIGAAAHPRVEGVDAGDLVVAELEVEDLDVLCDARGVRRLRDRRAALLDVPAQHDLGRALAVAFGDGCDGLVVHHAAALVAPPRVERDSADRRPRLREDAVLGVGALHVGLGEVGVQLDLVHGRNDGRGLEQPVEVRRREVADPDRPHASVGVQRLEGLVGGDRARRSVRGSGWCRISRSSWSTPSLRVAFSKACSVSS